ncbi:hypothetical protein [Streptomyces chryseus]|nr:hypothetical protein [Streptomyces chryseus]
MPGQQALGLDVALGRLVATCAHLRPMARRAGVITSSQAGTRP